MEGVCKSPVAHARASQGVAADPQPGVLRLELCLDVVRSQLGKRSAQAVACKAVAAVWGQACSGFLLGTAPYSLSAPGVYCNQVGSLLAYLWCGPTLEQWHLTHRGALAI